MFVCLQMVAHNDENVNKFVGEFGIHVAHELTSICRCGAGLAANIFIVLYLRVLICAVILCCRLRYRDEKEK